MAKKRQSKGVWQQLLHWLGPVQRQRFVHNAWLELIVVGSLVLVCGAVYGAASVMVAHQHNIQRQPKALALAHAQVEALRISNGLASSEQCFDTTGTPRVATDSNAPCSYTPDGRSGCLSTNAPYCYEVGITMVSPTSNDASQSDVPVTYRIHVRWSGRPVEHGQVTVDYRVVESNSAYNSEHTGKSGSGGSGMDATIGLANGVVGGVGTTPGGKFINTLADIPGGPSVSLAAATCVTASDCTIPKKAYDLTGHFVVSTNIPDKLITSCSWDFGDGTPLFELTNTGKGCLNGQVANYSYAGTWQMQPVSPYPLACPAPLGTSLDASTFLVRVTLHTTSGTDVVSASPHHAVMPSCYV